MDRRGGATKDPAVGWSVESGNVRRATLALPAIALPVGVAALTIEPRYGLLAAAVIMGWTQLVGL